MPYYVVPRIVDEDGSDRPDVPAGHGCGGLPHEGSYLVLAYPPLAGVDSLAAEALAAECATRGLELERVLVWRVGTHGGEEVL